MATVGSLANFGSATSLHRLGFRGTDGFRTGVPCVVSVLVLFPGFPGCASGFFAGPVPLLALPGFGGFFLAPPGPFAAGLAGFAGVAGLLAAALPGFGPLGLAAMALGGSAGLPRGFAEGRPGLLGLVGRLGPPGFGRGTIRSGGGFASGSIGRGANGSTGVGRVTGGAGSTGVGLAVGVAGGSPGDVGRIGVGLAPGSG